MCAYAAIFALLMFFGLLALVLWHTRGDQYDEPGQCLDHCLDNCEVCYPAQDLANVVPFPKKDEDHAG